MKENSSSYTIRAKTIDLIDRKLSFKKGPGPGDYEAVELNSTILRTKVSKYKGPKLGVGMKAPRFL